MSRQVGTPRCLLLGRPATPAPIQSWTRKPSRRYTWAATAAIRARRPGQRPGCASRVRRAGRAGGMQSAEFDDPVFLARLRAGDGGAYRRLIRRFHASLVSVANSIIGSRAQAEEVVQDAWLAVFNGIGRFEGRSSLATWLFS